MLVVAPRPLTIREIEVVLDVEPEQLTECLVWLSPKLLLADGDKYSIEFKSVTEYLMDYARSRKFSVDVKAVHSKLAIRIPLSERLTYG